MSLKEQEEQNLGPFTLEEAKQEMFRLENIATDARDTADASNILLKSLIFELHSKNILDVVSLLKGILDDCQNIEPANVRCAVEVLATSFLLEHQKRTAYTHN